VHISRGAEIMPYNPFVSNRQTRDSWERCAGHRRRILNLILEVSLKPGGRLCVLGAGNCNDLDLVALACHFAEIHLVDIDPEALASALRRQPPPGGRVVLHALCDLIAADYTTLGGPFNMVLSAGILTQMFQTIEDLDLPKDIELRRVLALRSRHLRLLFDLLAPGGVFILVTDVVSTATAPELNTCCEASLSEHLETLIEARNFFTGANPAAIWKELTERPEFAGRIQRIESHDPWLWPVTESHKHLTWAVTVYTRGD
jgi:hypothetical protein